MAVAALVLAAVLAGAGWWFFSARETPADWDRLAELDLAAPAGDAFREETPWARLLLAPARPGESNRLRVSVPPRRGTPVAEAPATPKIVAVTVQPLSSAGSPQSPPLQSGSDGTVSASPQLDAAGWWRLTVEFDGAPDPAQFYLLLPDPNINGPGAVPASSSLAEGEAVFQRALAATTALRTVRFTQWIADGRGNAAVSEHAVTAGGDGAPAGFTYRAAGGMEAVVIGSTRWVLLPGDLGWQRQEGAVTVPPADWDEEYFGATGFSILGEEEIDGERCQLIAFVVPELTEPRRQTVAWYLWWVGTETGHVRREAMASRLHYMLNAFGEFDAPLALEPPVAAATPAAGAPSS